MERNNIERVQKMALHVILGDGYGDYGHALETVQLETLEVRRTRLCLSFARKAEKHHIYKHWFRERPINNTRQPTDKYWGPVARTMRLKLSAIPYLTSLLNKHQF